MQFDVEPANFFFPWRVIRDISAIFFRDFSAIFPRFWPPYFRQCVHHDQLLAACLICRYICSCTYACICAPTDAMCLFNANSMYVELIVYIFSAEYLTRSRSTLTDHDHALYILVYSYQDGMHLNQCLQLILLTVNSRG